MKSASRVTPAPKYAKLILARVAVDHGPAGVSRGVACDALPAQRATRTISAMTAQQASAMRMTGRLIGEA